MDSWYSVIVTAVKKVFTKIIDFLKKIFFGSKKKEKVQPAAETVTHSREPLSKKSTDPPVIKQIRKITPDMLDTPLEKCEAMLLSDCVKVFYSLPSEYEFAADAANHAWEMVYVAGADHSVDLNVTEKALRKMVRCADKVSYELNNASLRYYARKAYELMRKELEGFRGSLPAAA